MYYKLKIAILIVLAIFTTHATAQKRDKAKLDTIYYLADTSRTPVLDRMVSIDFETVSNLGKLDSIQAFRINCKCLPHDYYPTFTRHVSKKRKEVAMQDLDKIKFTSLPDFLALVQKDHESDFYYKHVVIIIENIKKRYFAGEVFLTNYGGPVK